MHGTNFCFIYDGSSIVCAKRTDDSFKHSQHNCKLKGQITNAGWACNMKNGKDGCLSGFSDFYKSNGCCQSGSPGGVRATSSSAVTAERRKLRGLQRERLGGDV